MSPSENHWDRLPDDLAQRILLLLPTTSLLSARCASRRFLSLTTSPSFSRLHTPSSSDFFLILSPCSAAFTPLSPPSSSSSSSSSSSYRHLPLYSLCSLSPSHSSPVAASRGLVLFRTGDPSPADFVVCNPVLRSSRRLLRTERVRYVDVVGMNYDAERNFYTVLVAGMTKSDSPECVTEVYDSRTGVWEVHSRSSQEFLQSFYEVHAIWYEGNFYFLESTNNNLIGYDMRRKEWRDLAVWMPEERLRRPSLVVAGGKLLLVGKVVQGFRSQKICVWELRRWEENSLRWVLLDTMPYHLFKLIHHPYSTSLRYQGHKNFVFFNKAKAVECIMYDMSKGKWCLIPENECNCRGKQEAGRNALVGMLYEPSLTAGV